jgi:hypothetical protein
MVCWSGKNSGPPESPEQGPSPPPSLTAAPCLYQTSPRSLGRIAEHRLAALSGGVPD